MMCYQDKTFCASLNCKNACGRQITDRERGAAQRLGLPISWAYFCDLPLAMQASIKLNEAPE